MIKCQTFMTNKGDNRNKKYIRKEGVGSGGGELSVETGSFAWFNFFRNS